MQRPIPPMSPPLGGKPIALSPATYGRVAAATNYFEQQGRVRNPLTGAGQGVGRAAGCWGLLASGATISGSTISGTTITLGTGSVTLCTRSGTSCTAVGDTVTVYNAGGSMTAPTGGKVLKLGWTDGDWSVDVAICPS